MKLSPKQAFSLGDATARVNLWEGSVRSGKTFGSTIRMLSAIAAHPTGGQIVICGKNSDTIYRNFFAPIQAIPELAFLNDHVIYRQGASTAQIFGQTVHIIGANDGRAESRLRGITVVLAYVDEVTVLPENFFKQLLARMSPPGAQLFATTNPDSPAHWLKTDYLDRLDELPHWHRYHFTLDDNPALTEEYKQAIKAEYSGLWYRRFILGEWVAAEGAIFDMWDTNKHVTPWQDTPHMARTLAIGMDYGTTNPTAAVLIGQDKQGDLWVIDEYRVDETNRGNGTWTDQQLSNGFTRWLNETQHHPTQLLDPPRFIFLDPAAASMRAQLIRDGHQNIRAANNDVLDGIKTLTTQLGLNRLHVTDRCKGLINELPGYSWDAKATEAGIDKPIKTADHSIDALRYAVHTTRTIWQRYQTPTS